MEPARMGAGRATLLGLLLVAATAAAAFGATITVDETADELNADGDCSLREALRAADVDSPIDACTPGNGDDVVVVPAGTYAVTIPGSTSTTGSLDVSATVTISGAAAATTIIDATGLGDQVIHHTGGTLTIEDVTITGGDAATFGGGIGSTAPLVLTDVVVTDNKSALRGGGIDALGSLALAGSTISGNQSGGNGGGIHAEAALTIVSSTVSGNTGNVSGGIEKLGTGDVLIEDSTITGNMATRNGGLGLDPDGDTVTILRSTISGNTATSLNTGGLRIDDGTLVLENVTLSGNRATSSHTGGMLLSTGSTVTINSSTITLNESGPGSSPAGIAVTGASAVTLSNTILAGNLSGDPMGHDCSGTITSADYNVIGDTFGCTLTLQPGDQSGVAPNLGPLQDNGGPTLTHRPLGPPALDAGNPAAFGGGAPACPTDDQRGIARIGRCDVGAVEASATPTTSSSTSTTTTSTSSTSTPTIPGGSTTTSTGMGATTTTTSIGATTTTTSTLPVLCVGGATIAKPKLILAKRDGTTGNEKLVLKGTLEFAAGMPADFDPVTTGFQMDVSDVVPVFAPPAVPAGARGTGCHAKDGWRGTSYKNRSGALDPPTCTAGSANGLRLVALKDKRAKGKGIVLTVKARKAAVPETSGPFLVTVVLGADAAAGERGACATHVFAAGDCTAKGKKLTCK